MGTWHPTLSGTSVIYKNRDLQTRRSSKSWHRDESEKCFGEGAQSQGTCSDILFHFPSRPTVTSHLVFVVCREIFGGAWCTGWLMEKSCRSRFPHAVLWVLALPSLLSLCFTELNHVRTNQMLLLKVFVYFCMEFLSYSYFHCCHSTIKTSIGKSKVNLSKNTCSVVSYKNISNIQTILCYTAKCLSAHGGKLWLVHLFSCRGQQHTLDLSDGQHELQAQALGKESLASPTSIPKLSLSYLTEQCADCK